MVATNETGCAICRGASFDIEFGRTLIWQDDLWRLSTSFIAPVVGFSYLEPRRHIPHITDLDGPEAATLGPTLARVTRLLERETRADLIYVLVFGERVAHLHFNLAPHPDGDALTGGSGLANPDAPVPSPDEHRDFVDRLRASAGEAL
jgi:diadenosine tetraphosphate (Ap4A) HIT family hydrolase